MEHTGGSMESPLFWVPTKVGSPCAPSWARRARARPAPQTSASQTNGP